MKNKMRSKKIMWITLVILVLIIISVFIFLKIPYSKIKADFNSASTTFMKKAVPTNEIFTKEDIKDLPIPVKKYFNYCGFIGTRKMSYMKATFKNVTFKTGKDKPTLSIDYTQYNFASKPDRIAFIDSSMFGIPFQGFDSYLNGVGSMKGVVAKFYTMFDQRGEAMDKASLVTYLAECFIVPSVVLQDYITWEAIDETHAKATISYYGISASGIFTFNDNGEMVSFTTNDRVATETDGTTKKVQWTAICSDYKESNGIKKPTILKAIWHYNEGDQVYFNGDEIQIDYDYNM
ncbi:hypothetical protein LGK97_01970 [Clostridium sp. CS001]|uniref:DUF6544 family protein n=1 Tax=Clostridium sp. CS001 TaxID=2880648 RepID=UPI001CF1620A|nr:DUF6544 family protein [Clostridium sp. CS001]MCB2288530.1 hypothetical protein [Clostridium sp. CS001]